MMEPKRIHNALEPGHATENPMTYPPPNPYDPNQSPGYGQPSPAPQHYTTDADPYSRPDPYGPGAGYPTAPSHPNSAPPGQPYSPGPAYPQPGGYTQPPVGPLPQSTAPQAFAVAGGAFQPGQAAPPPPGGGSTNTPLIITLVVVVIAVIGGGIMLGLSMSGDDDPDPKETTAAAADETSEEVEETTAAEPTEEETTEDESVYRVPAEGECIENNPEGFYVVACDSDAAYWEVLKVVQSPEDPEPTDAYHTVAATDACAGSGNTNYYYTDTAILAGRDWDPEIDSITAVYCVKEV